MTKEAKHTVVFLVVLIVVFFTIDWAFGKIAFKLLVNMPAASNEIAKMNYQIEEADYDCYVLGSSRAVHHYNPDIISDILDVSVYNAGRDGQGISYACGLLKAIVDRGKPQIVILECGIIELSNEWLEKVSVLKPYYIQHPSILALAKKINGEAESIKTMSGLYRFNSLVLPILKTYFIATEDTKRGFEPSGVDSTKYKLLSFKNNTRITFESDVMSMSVFAELINICKENDIKLYVFCSPVLYEYSDVGSHMQKVCDEYCIPFYDYSNDTSFVNHTNLFSDYVHLNENGAKIYSQKITNDILKKAR